jgi:hypothetical protein
MVNFSVTVSADQILEALHDDGFEQVFLTYDHPELPGMILELSVPGMEPVPNIFHDPGIIQQLCIGYYCNDDSYSLSIDRMEEDEGGDSIFHLEKLSLENITQFISKTLAKGLVWRDTYQDIV